MAEAATGNLVIADLGDERRSQRLEMASALAVPAARATRRSAGEAGRFDEGLQILGQPRPLCRRDRGRKADVIEQPLIIVESEKQRADLVHLTGIAKAADHAVCGALLLDLDHCAFARAIFKIRALGYDSIARAATSF